MYTELSTIKQRQDVRCEDDAYSSKIFKEGFSTGRGDPRQPTIERRKAEISDKRGDFLWVSCQLGRLHIQYPFQQRGKSLFKMMAKRWGLIHPQQITVKASVLSKIGAEHKD